MWAMTKAFDEATGLPRASIEMLAWPKMNRLSEAFGVILWRALMESFYPSSTSEGILVMFDRFACFLCY